MQQRSPVRWSKYVQTCVLLAELSYSLRHIFETSSWLERKDLTLSMLRWFFTASDLFFRSATSTQKEPTNCNTGWSMGAHNLQSETNVAYKKLRIAARDFWGPTKCFWLLWEPTNCWIWLLWEPTNCERWLRWTQEPKCVIYESFELKLIDYGNTQTAALYVWEPKK